MTAPEQNQAILPPGEALRQAMRRWATGVAVVTSRYEETQHGMTVNSFGSISLDPPLVTVTMNNNTRTFQLVKQSGIFAVTVLSHNQQHIAEVFAGRALDPQGHEVADRFAGLDIFTMQTGAPLFTGGLAFVDCRLVFEYPMPLATLMIGEVVEARPHSQNTVEESLDPLIYLNRSFLSLR